MDYRIAIHPRNGSFSDRWIEYCTEHGLEYEIVNCYDSRIIDLLGSFNVLLWQFHHVLAADLFMARSVLRSAEEMGLRVFPNAATCWHFDDKVAQKYLLESIGAPMARAEVFYDLETALKWIASASFPVVFKLSRGAGSGNVRLVANARKARRLAKQAFGRGFKATGGVLTDVKTRVRKHRRAGDVWTALKRGPGAFIRNRRQNRARVNEKGYVYFQEFHPDNHMDTRITVIGDRAFGFTRAVRPNDFRASGSGSIDHDVRKIDMRCVEVAFDVARRLRAQSLALDFVRDSAGHSKIVEISYGYLPKIVYECPGHWNSKGEWKDGKMRPEDAILIDLLQPMR